MNHINTWFQLRLHSWETDAQLKCMLQLLMIEPSSQSPKRVVFIAVITGTSTNTNVQPSRKAERIDLTIAPRDFSIHLFWTLVLTSLGSGHQGRKSLKYLSMWVEAVKKDVLSKRKRAQLYGTCAPEPGLLWNAEERPRHDYEPQFRNWWQEREKSDLLPFFFLLWHVIILSMYDMLIEISGDSGHCMDLDFLLVNVWILTFFFLLKSRCWRKSSYAPHNSLLQ